MLRDVLIGTAAGAVGTVALNFTTYADMALRGRPSAKVPAEVAGKLAEKTGVDLDVILDLPSPLLHLLGVAGIRETRKKTRQRQRPNY